MKMRAAVLEEFGQPLAVQEVELAEPRAGEVLVRLVACGVCHTDLYTASGADPSGLRAGGARPRGRRRRRARSATDVTSLAPGDHVVTLFSPQCRECVHCLDPRTNLCLAIREQQNKGFLPDGTTRLSRDGERIRHFMGCSTFAEYTVMPEIALAKVDPEAPFEHACLFACGLSTGLGAAINTAAVEPGSTCVVFGAGHGRARRGRRLPAAGRRADRLRRPLARSGSSWPAARARPTRSSGGRGRRRADPRDDRRLRRRLHLRGDRQRRRDAPGGRVGAHGLGPLHGRRRRRQGRDARRRPALPDHRPPRRRLLVRRRQGPRPGAGPGRALRWPARSTSSPSSPTGSALDEVNRGFELMEAQDGIRSVIEFG